MMVSSYLLLALTAVAVALLVALLVRRPKFETPADLAARLSLLEQSAQGLSQSCARLEGSVERIARDFAGFSQATTAALDGKLERIVGESRSGRQELVAAFGTLKQDVGGQLGVMSGALKDQLEGSGAQIRDRLLSCSR